MHAMLAAQSHGVRDGLVANLAHHRQDNNGVYCLKGVLNLRVCGLRGAGAQTTSPEPQTIMASESEFGACAHVVCNELDADAVAGAAASARSRTSLWTPSPASMHSEAVREPARMCSALKWMHTYVVRGRQDA